MSKPVECVQVEVIDPNPTPHKYKLPMYRMPDGPGHYFGRPKAGNADCGQKHVIAFLVELSQAWSFHTHKFGIGDIFVPAGPSHKSHYMGSAVDIFVINKNGTEHQVEPVTYKSSNYSNVETTELAQLIAIMVLKYSVLSSSGRLRSAVNQILFNDKEIQTRVHCSPSIT